jgi:hypothetical protein
MFQTGTMTVMAALLAHQGGWDEVLLVAVPLLVVGGLLALANRRARTQLGAVERPDHASPDTGDAPPDPHGP